MSGWDWAKRGIADVATGGLYEGYKYMQDQAGQGYDTAAQGAKQAQQGYQDLANTQWDRSQEGLDKANAAYGPSNGLWYQTYGSQGPNAMDQWWGKNQGSFSQPTQTSGALNQFKGYMGQPTSTGSAYQNAQSALGGYQTSTGAYNDRFGGQLTGNRSAAEMAYDPTRYQAPGAAEQFGGYAQNRIGGMGATEELRYGNVNNMGAFASNLANQQGTGATQRGSGEIGGYYRDANDVSSFANQQMPGLGQKGLYEQFVQADITGSNPLLQRTTDQGLARINQEMARRGGFKSGGADTAIGNFMGEMAAQDYQNRANRAQSAQGMELARIGAGQSLASASAQSKLAQGQSLQGLAGQTDAEAMSRFGQQLAAQQGASSEGLANRQGALGYAQAADQTSLARTQALAGIANQGQAAQLARLQGGMAAAGQNDQGYLNRMNAGYGMAQGADTAQLARAQGLYGMAQGADQAQMARYAQLAQLSGQQDQGDLARLMGAGAMAGQTTQANQQQLNDMFRTRFGIDQGIAGNTGQFYGMGMNAYGQEMGNSLNALANYYGLQGQGQMARGAVLPQMVNWGIQGGRALSGGGG